ncbi:MAG: redox-regulated ATPase YchF [Rhodobacteraceae bacterium]|nr:redox-regulated ATPase YchF [Paracoccaceae bacterium]
MGFKTGIVGLPNVGKSTIFNALTRTAAAQAANYPFCTIEPNTGDVAVPDPRLDAIAAHAGSRLALSARTRFVDIAGLVKGAAQGEGLGNRFLGSIREVDAIAHVLRCFENDDIVHVHGTVDPLNDVQVVETELILADLESIERQSQALKRHVKGGDADAILRQALLDRAAVVLNDGRPAREVDIVGGERTAWRQIGLLTAKKVMYVCNVAEQDMATGNAQTERIAEHARSQSMPLVLCSAALEEQLGHLDRSEAAEYLAMIGCEGSGLSQLVRIGYDLLGLITFFTAGPKETCARPVRAGATAPEAAGRIHADFRRGFIRAETVSFDDFIAADGFAGARAAGKIRAEGKSYIVQDGDIMNFLFNV